MDTVTSVSRTFPLEEETKEQRLQAESQLKEASECLKGSSENGNREGGLNCDTRLLGQDAFNR